MNLDRSGRFDNFGNGSVSSSIKRPNADLDTGRYPDGGLSDRGRVDLSRGGYSNMMAQLTRQQYADYLKRFQPTENSLIKNATTNDLYDLQVARNNEITSGNYNRTNQQQAAAQEKYGLTDRRTDQQKRNLDTTRGLALASMNNESRQAIGDLQRNIMTGAAGGTRQHINKLSEQ